MATFNDLLSFVFPSTTFMVDTRAEPEEPPPLTRRGPGEHVPPGLDLISACHDSSLIDRILSGLGRGFDKSGGRDSVLPLLTSSYIKREVSQRGRVINSVGAGLRQLSRMTMGVIDFMTESIAHEPVVMMESETDKEYASHSVPSRKFYVKRSQPGPEDDKVKFSPVVMQGYMASHLKFHYEGSPTVRGVFRPGLGANVLDIRVVTATGELVRLQGARAIAAKVGLIPMRERAERIASALQACSSDKCRFGIIGALPYFVVTELVVIDGEWHLLISDLCSAVVEPEHSTVKSRSLMGVLLGIFMNDFDDYRVEGHSSEVKQRIRDHVKHLDALNVVNEVQSTDDVPPRDSMLDNSPPAQTNTAPSDEAAASTSIRRPDDTSDSSEELEAFVNQGNQTVMARHCPKQAIVCDVKELPDSRMVAIPIELEVDTAPALSPQQPPAKKIRLDSDAHRPKLTEALSLAIQELFSPDAFFSKAEGTFSSPLASTLTSRLNLVRRVGRGASSSVWQAEWLHHSAGSACPSASASTRERSFTTSASSSMPTPSSETTPNTSPQLPLDVMSTPYPPPAPYLPLAMSGRFGPSSKGVGRGRLAAKVVWEEYSPSIAREYFVYTSIVPLLSSQAQEYFSAFHGLYRSGNEGQTYILVMEDAGSPITHKQLEADAELKAKVDFALNLIADEGLHHNDEGARNVLLRPDGRICLIDWGEAQVR
ncbi:BQ5605_C010g06093 [Microbotryum silenes-dioicae]|uniref:BQ5605_C010g06093 protein n=1 Tax=Microbotryum silenes-dioicae TaxID=796604 RepID=A0A2X0LQK9_9BASI|nr:BQ5605_C010g06093 [Microbotryum silenes-dioicae]